DARRDRHRGLHDHTRRRAAAVGNAREHLKLAHSEVAGDFHLLAGVHRERDETVDVGRLEAGILDRGEYRFTGQLQFGATRFLGEFGLPDARDRGATRKAAARHDPDRAGTPRRAVPPTCSPNSFIARRATSIITSSPSRATAVTSPE